MENSKYFLTSLAEDTLYSKNTNSINPTKCLNGFASTKEQCVDVDECQHSLAICDLNASCINTLGSFKCKCNRGFIGMGVKGFLKLFRQIDLI